MALEWIDEADYLGETVKVTGIHGTARDVPMAKVLNGVGSHEIQLNVAVVKECETRVLLGLDSTILDYGMKLAM